MFAREGFPFMIGSALLAAVVFGLALRLRSWPVWLAAFALAVISLCVSWAFRELPTA